MPSIMVAALALRKICTMERRVCVINVPLTLHSNPGYSNIKYHSNSASDPNARLLNSINDAVIDDCNEKERIRRFLAIERLAHIMLTIAVNGGK